jgi:hypothetical protein
MRAVPTRCPSVRSFVVAAALSGAGACGGGKTAVQTPADAQTADASDAVADRSGDAREAVDRPTDVAVDAPADVVEGGAGDLTAEAPERDAPDARADATVPADAPTERPSATASWTLAPFATCAEVGAGCMDTGAVGGYELTASALCPTASDIQLWFPGGATPLPAGAYAVKAAAGILDVIAMPAGMVGVLAERDDAAMTHSKFWGRAGTVTVTAAGTARHVTFAGVSLREETSSAMTTLGGDMTCP